MIVVPTLHPAALLRGRDEESGLSKFEETVKADIGKAIRLTRERPRWDERVIWERDSVGRLKNLFPTPEEVIEFCRNALGHPTSTDVESTGEQVMAAQLMCAGFASSNGTALCVPFLKRGGSRYWAPHDEQRVRWAVGQLLADRSTVKILHNKEFDKTVYWLNGLPVDGPTEDCYVESETEFLTEFGWRKYDDIKQGTKLATVSKTGQLEYQDFFRRVSKPYTGVIHTIETAHSRAVVTHNHRMFVRPFYRQRTEKIGEWEFRRAEKLGQGSDQFDVRVGFEAGNSAGARFADGVSFGPEFMRMFGLWITDGCLIWPKQPKQLQAWQRGPRGFRILQAPNGPAIHELNRLKKFFTGMLKRQRSMVRWRHPKGKRRFRKTVTEVTFELNHPMLASKLLDWCGRYSKNRRLPDFVLGLAEDLRAALLQGLLLGDSGIVAGRRVYRTACKGLAGDVQALALSLGYAATIHWAGGCWGVTLWKQKLDRAGTGAAYDSVKKRKRSARVVCFSVPNETLVTRSRGKPAFHGNTMQQHHVIDSELPHALGYCMTRYLDARYHKDDVKGAEGWLYLDDEQLRSYNLRDCIGTRELFPVFCGELNLLGARAWALYRQECELTALMARATVRGLAVDFWRRDCETASIPVYAKDGKTVVGYQKGLGPRLRDQMNGALATLRQLAGHSSFDPMKPAQLKWLLFDRLKFPIVKMSESGLHPSTDKEAMVLLALAAGTAEQRACIKALADFKQGQKFLSTFVEGLKITGDGRFHPTWKMLTTSGRFASSPNAQNWRKNVKAIFCAGEPRFSPDQHTDWEYSGVDLKQAEMRGIAYDAHDPRLLQMYQQDLNVHTVNLAMSLRVRPPIGHGDLDPATEAYIRTTLPQLLGIDFSALIEMTGNALKGARTLIKNDGFGRNYGGEDEVVFGILRAARDPDTNELLFPNLKRSEVEANGVMWRKLNVGIVRWWTKKIADVKRLGYYQCPISGRIRWFRGGQKRTDVLGTPIQMMIASFMNERTLEIQAAFDRELSGQALVVQQVHDALNSENLKSVGKRVAEIKTEILSRPISLPGHPNAVFPPDKILRGSHLSDV